MSDLKRWICWPNPDQICLDGGCSRCTLSHSRRKVTRAWVATYAVTNGYVLEERWLDNGMFAREAPDDPLEEIA